MVNLEENPARYVGSPNAMKNVIASQLGDAVRHVAPVTLVDRSTNRDPLTVCVADVKNSSSEVSYLCLTSPSPVLIPKESPVSRSLDVSNRAS